MKLQPCSLCPFWETSFQAWGSFLPKPDWLSLPWFHWHFSSYIWWWLVLSFQAHCMHILSSQRIVHWDHDSPGIEVNGGLCTILVERWIQPQTSIVSWLWRENAKSTDMFCKTDYRTCKTFHLGVKEKKLSKKSINCMFTDLTDLP